MTVFLESWNVKARVSDRVRSESGKRKADADDFTTTAPSFLRRDGLELSLRSGQLWPKQSGGRQSSLTAPTHAISVPERLLGNHWDFCARPRTASLPRR